MRPISRARAHMPQGKAVRPEKQRPWLDASGSEHGTIPQSAHQASTTDSQRLDTALVSRGIAQTRTKARRLIEGGLVQVDGSTQAKAARKVSSQASISVSQKSRSYVSRGAYKLLGAFERFTPLGLASPAGRNCLDIGASTGGFTQVLLEHDAYRVIALDVGHGQLDPQIAANSRVIEMSGINIRDVDARSLPYLPAYIVSDVSFISLTYVLPVIAQVAAPGAEVVLLVKPQFEVGKGNLGKNGVVTDAHLREHSLEKVEEAAKANGLKVMASADSPIEGTHGNVEYLLWLRAIGPST